MNRSEERWTLLNEKDLETVTGGMTPGAAWKILTTSTKTGRSAIDEQPYYLAQQEAARKAQTAAAVQQMKDTTPDWRGILQPSPFAPKVPTMPTGLLKPTPFPGHPEVTKGHS